MPSNRESGTFAKMFNRYETYRVRKSGLFLMLLFVWYFACTTIFTHVHLSNGVLYVHSHPYARNSENKPLHTHTAGEFQLIHEYNQTLVDDSLENTNFSSERDTLLQVFEPAWMLDAPVIAFHQHLSLRAPPVLAA